MAKIKMTGLDEYAKDLHRLYVKAPGIMRYAIYPAAKEALDALKANTPVENPKVADNLRESERLTRFRDENDGSVYTTIIFPGYDENGHPNSIKARVLESGSSKQPKRPFIRPTMKAIESQVIETMKKNLDVAIEAAMNGGQ